MNETTNTLQRNPVEQLGEEFVDRLRAGESPSLSEFIARRPDLEAEIRKLFPTLIMLEQAGSDDGSSLRDVPVTRDGTAPEQIGDYRILREVGRGGMGVVYEAEQESLGRHVALKVLPFAALMDPNHLKRFQREARAAARLHHSNIVPVYGVGEHDGIHFYAMQFIQGQGLDEVLAELKTLQGEHPYSLTKTTIQVGKPAAGWEGETTTTNRQPAEESSNPSHVGGNGSSQYEYYCRIDRIGADVADALSYAHQQGILHRDVKPSNLMLDAEGHIWITDFGLAKTDAKEDLTHTGDLVGTLRYMAPERFDGWSDPRSDVYGLGLTLYEMLTLRSAFSDGDRARLIRRVTTEDPPRPRRIDRNIPADLETIVLKAIAKESGNRYASAERFAADLRRFLNKQPIEARRTPVVERAKLWCRRNPLVASLVAIVVLLMVIGGGGAAWSAVHFERIASDRQQALDDKDEVVQQLTKAKRIAVERLYHSARYHYDRKEYDLAVKEFTALLEADPNNVDALWWRGLAWGRLDECQKAADDYTRYIKLKPGFAKAYPMRGFWRKHAGKYQQAVKDYRKGLELGLTHPAYRSYIAWCQAMSSPAQRNLDDALQQAKRAVAGAPRLWKCRMVLGIVHYRRKEYIQAIRALEAADRLSHDYAFHCYFLAMSHHQQGDLEKAVHYYQQADRKRAWGRRQPAYLLREQNAYRKEAAALITQTLKQQPDHFELRLLRVRFRYRMEDFEGMARDTAQLIELRPKSIEGYYERAVALWWLGRTDESILCLQKVLALQPDHPGSQLRLAWLRLTGPESMRDHKRARELAFRAERRRRGSPHYLLTLGIAEYRLGRYKQARDTLAKAAHSRDDGVHSIRLLFLAMIYHHLDQPDKARESYEEALRRWQVTYCPAAELKAIKAEVERVIGKSKKQ